MENEVDNYIKKNVTVKKTLLDKLKAITAYPAQFPYNASYYRIFWKVLERIIEINYDILEDEDEDY